MLHHIATLASFTIGASVATWLTLYLRSNRDRIAAALEGRPIRPHD